MFVKAEVRDSKIFGKGLFALEAVRKGTIVCFFSLHGSLISEEQYVKEVAGGNWLVTRTGTRYVGRHFTWCDDVGESSFFNHSFTPNVLCHCGICIALEDIPAGGEMTLDYRYLVDDTEVGVYNDATTGRPIRGLSARQTLLETTRQMLRLIEGLPEWDGRP